MALRSFASTVLPRFGFRLQPLAFDLSQTLERTFASKVVAEFKYTKDHEWVSVDGDIATVGVTDFAQKQLGDVVFVEPPVVGNTVTKDGELGVIESVKAASDLYAPVSGEVTEVNAALADSPELANSDPYGDGWVAKIKISNPSELDELLDATQYTAHTADAE